MEDRILLVWDKMYLIYFKIAWALLIERYYDGQ